MKRFILLAAAVVASAILAAPARAGFADTLQAGANGYEDISREHVYFQNGSAGLQVGDVITGFSQIQTRTNGPRTFDTIYAVFSETVSSITTSNGVTTVQFTATAASNPESLQSILAGTGVTVSNGVLAAVFDRPQGNSFGKDLVNQVPSTGANMNNYLQYIANNGKYEAGFGFAATGQNNFLTATTKLAASAITPTLLNNTPNSVTLASFDGGLSLIDNNTNKKFLTNVLGDDGTLHDLTITRGSLNGGKGDKNYNNFGNPGVGDNASFNVFIGGVPEPSSIVLLSIGLAGFAGRSLLRRRKEVTA